MNTTPNLGEIAYKAYCKAIEYKDTAGNPMPHFEQLSPERQKAWIEASAAISNIFMQAALFK